MGTSLVRESTAAGTDGTADQCAFTTSHEAADNRSTRSRANYDLRARVVLMVTRLLSSGGTPMAALCSGFLATRAERKRKHRGESEQGDSAVNDHGILHSTKHWMRGEGKKRACLRFLSSPLPRPGRPQPERHASNPVDLASALPYTK